MSLGETVNALLDGLLAAADRLLQMPLFVVLLAAGLLAMLLGVALARWTRAAKHPALRRGLTLALIATVAGAVLFALDQRLARIEERLRELASTRPIATQPAAVQPAQPAASQAPAPPPPQPTATSAPSPRRALSFDLDSVRKSLLDTFGEVDVDATVCDDATDSVQLHFHAPLARAYLAIVDLQRPGLEVALGTDLVTKTLTSTFAQKERCFVAVNGEAGMSPFPRSGLGHWTGHFVQQGKVLLREQDGNPRPFLSFDRQNHASFRAMAASDRAVPKDAWNVIWGRMDAILGGEVQLADWGNRQPRTAMGIDATGRRLYLLVVDGRQPRFSMGFTRGEVGMLLKLFGAHDAMLCDEGGSSCLYLDALGGIVNIPSDNQGQERTTYTHFGIRRAAQQTH